MPENTISAKAAAQLFRISTRWLQQLAKDGIIPKVSNGRYPLVQMVGDYVDHLRAKIISGDVDESININLERGL